MSSCGPLTSKISHHFATSPQFRCRLKIMRLTSLWANITWEGCGAPWEHHAETNVLSLCKSVLFPCAAILYFWHGLLCAPSRAATDHNIKSISIIYPKKRSC